MLIEEIENEMQKKILESFVMHMANLKPSTTGLPVVVWIGKVGGHHGPRIKVSNILGKASEDCFVMSVSKEPQVLTPKTCKISNSLIEAVSDWIKMNYDELLLAYKQFETDDANVSDTLSNLRKL